MTDGESLATAERDGSRGSHLIAIKLRVALSRDLLHVGTLLQQAKIDRAYLQSVLERYRLKEKWQAFMSEASQP